MFVHSFKVVKIYTNWKLLTTNSKRICVKKLLGFSKQYDGIPLQHRSHNVSNKICSIMKYTILNCILYSWKLLYYPH